jgi:hypothetical protein
MHGTDTLVYGFRTAMTTLLKKAKQTKASRTGADVAQHAGVMSKLGNFPKIVTAQRLQNWLLVAALAAIGLTALLVVDLARNLRTVVISEANRALTNAVGELAVAG